MKLLYLTTEDSTFWTHRRALARAARNQNAEIIIMTRWGEHSVLLEGEGFRVIPWKISRRSMNPFREFKSVLQVWKIYRKEKPDLVHHIALKPIVYGALVSRWYRIATVNTVTGLGPVFIRESAIFKVLRFVLRELLRVSFRASNCRVIFQNNADRTQLLDYGIGSEERSVVIPGFGIDINSFYPAPEADGEYVVMLPARMVWEKGVGEFVQAAEELRKRGVAARMVLVGSPDRDNPGCIPEERLKEWSHEKHIEWWHRQGDMPAVLHKAHLVCLPSYREGFPKVLGEAAACGRAIVTTEGPGCSSVVKDGQNGLLVPVKDARALADAIQELLQDSGRRMQMGTAGRERAVKEFSEERIIHLTIGVYERLLKGKWRFAQDSVKRNESQMAANI